MIYPTIHSNGTGAETLLEGYIEALSAVRDAMESFSKIEFNARDYYVQEPTAWDKAREEQRDRVLKLKSVYDDLMKLAEHCSDAIAAKETRIREQQERYAQSGKGAK